MDPSNSILFKLRKSLNNDLLPWVVSSLRHDPIVWNYLQTEFSEIDMDKKRDQPIYWSPASLSLLALEVPIKVKYLQKTPLESLPSQLRSKAAKEFENWKYSDNPNSLSLKKAGLLALALRERLRIIGNWNGFLEEIDPKRQTIEEIGTPLSCLYGMIPKPNDLVLSILPNFDLAIHILLSNPIHPDSIKNFLKSILDTLISENHIVLLKKINPHVPKEASELARYLLSSNQIEDNANPKKNDYKTGLYQFARQPQKAIPYLKAIIEESRHKQASCLAQLSNDYIESGDINAGVKALEQAYKLSPSSSKYLVGWLKALLDSGHPNQAQEIIQGINGKHSSLPEFLILKSRLAMTEGKFDQARQNAVLALESLCSPKSHTEDNLGSKENASDLSFHFSSSKEQAIELTELFLELNLCHLAVKSAKIALKTDPSDPELHKQISRAHQMSGEPLGAIESAHLAFILRPQELDYHRYFAKTLEDLEEWNQALNERELILQKVENLKPSEVTKAMKDLARCAMMARNFERAAEICRDLLSRNPEDGYAHTLLGDAFYNMGDPDSAQDHYHLATQHSPKLADPWLAMARNHIREKQPDKAIEILRTASHAVPENPRILLNLGKIYLEQKSSTQALDVLKKASEKICVVDEPDLYLDLEYHLGQTLYELGHLRDARGRLEKAYASLPAETSLAQLYAKILLELNETNAALTPLARIVQSNPDNPHPYISYANALIETKESIVEAIHPLQKAIDYSSEGSYERFVAQALLAEALMGAGETEEAQEIFEEILESDYMDSPDWSVRVPLGLARALIDSGDCDRAIAIMEEINRIDPENPKIYYHLAEAFQEANLYDNAYHAARSSLNLNPNDLDTLVWFSDLVLNSLGREIFDSQERHQKEMEAIEALNRATQLDPDCISLYVRLGDALLETGNTSGAWDAYFKVMTFDNSITSSETIFALKKAADGFTQLGDTSNAVSSLEKALELTSKTDTDLLIALAKAQNQAGHPQLALNILSEATEKLPNHIDLHLQKIDLLTELERPQAALAALESAINANPDSPEFRMRAANLLRTLGDLPKALEYAETFTDTKNPKTLFLAADIARSSLNPKRSRQILGIDPSNLSNEVSLENMSALEKTDYLCLCAELALEAGDHKNIILKYLKKIQALEDGKPHPRAIALSARMSLRDGEYDRALQEFEHALQEAHIKTNKEGSFELPLEEEKNPSLILALCEAAIEIGHCDLAVFLAERVVLLTPMDLRTQMTLAITLVLRTEVYKLCENLEVINNSPNEDSKSNNSFQIFVKAIETSYRIANDENLKETIAEWELRGEASFNGVIRNIQVLEEIIKTNNNSPIKIASYIAILRHTGNTGRIKKLSNRFPANPHVQTQVLLALAEKKPEEALQIAQMISNHHAVHGRMGINQPLLYCLTANLAFNTNQVSIAHNAIQNALDIWKDEPRWNELAAKILQSLNDQEESSQIPKAIEHLKRAIDVEPARASYWLELGKIYMNQNSLEDAIKEFEKATKFAKDHPESWYYLAKAQLENRDLTQAALSADQAILLDPNQVGALILRAEIALEADDPESAYKLAKDALRLQPNNPEILVLLARGLESLDKPEDALKVLELGLETLPKSLNLSMERVRLIRRYQGLEDVLEALQHIVQDHPNDPRVLSVLAESLAEAGKVDSSIQIAQRALKSSEGVLSEAEKSHLHYLLGRLMRRKGQLDQAIHHLDKATDPSPKRLEPYIELGLVHQDRRDLGAALDAFENAISIAPQDHRPYYYAGIAFKDSKDYRSAEEMLRRAAELNPSEVSIHRQLGALVALNIVHGRV